MLSASDMVVLSTMILEFLETPSRQPAAFEAVQDEYPGGFDSSRKSNGPRYGALGPKYRPPRPSRWRPLYANS